MLLTLIAGLSDGVLLFLVASGLSLIFGVLGVLNFSHGGFFALGAFVTHTLTRGAQLEAWQFVALALVGGVLVGGLGLVVEATVFRRIYHLAPIDALLATYAVLLTIQGAITQLWGVEPLGQAMPAAFLQLIQIGTTEIPSYEAFVVAVGAVVVVGLWVFLERSDLGRSVRAVAADRGMAACLGIDVRRVFALMVGLGTALAGLGGALVAPRIQITSGLASTYVIESFAVVIVGGLGSMPGALLAAVLLGLLNSLVVTFDPALSGFSLYLGMAVVLLLRPQGLLGTDPERR